MLILKMVQNYRSILKTILMILDIKQYGGVSTYSKLAEGLESGWNK